MLMAYAELLIGIATGLTICITLMRWPPLLRELLAAMAAAGILDLLPGNHQPQGVDSIFDRLAAAISGHPYFALGLVFGAATLLHGAQSQ
jgi:hypothetical protein